MIKQELNWAFLRTYVQVENEQTPDLKVSYQLRTVDSCQLDCEFNHETLLTTEQVNESGLYGDQNFKDNINKVWYLDLTLSSDKPIVMPKTLIDVRLSVDNIQSLWLPSIQAPGKNYRAKGMLEYYANVTTHICHIAPMGAFYSAEGINKLSFALSDCKNVVTLTGGAYEEEECARFTFTLFEAPSAPVSQYQVSLRLDSSAMNVFNAVKNISRYYERSLNLDVMGVPEAALEPVYSTWYAFLQNLSAQEIEDQCAIAASLGCKTVIVDDGWQTDDNNRGYSYCGDWEVSKRRFPNMKEHVAKVHALGMKYMLWFSVPFVGGKSKNGPEYKDYSLCYNPRWGAYVLDPRYKKVRDFLVNTYVNTVKEYDLDGLKLDFIDEFDMRQADEKARAYDDKRDTQSLVDAVDMLMTEVRNALSAIKSDILIEFRQNYVGPMIRKYGNMFRAHDCPNDTLMNRMTTCDVRAMALDTAVHSDMFTWSPSESVQSASLQFIHTLFSVPQISPNLKHLNEDHLAMVKHWLSFCSAHRDLLLKGHMEAFHPEVMYSKMVGTLNNEQIIIVGNDQRVELFNNEAVDTTYLVNGAMLTSLVIKSTPEHQLNLKAEIFDCLGKQVQVIENLQLDSKLYELAMPKSGYVKFTKI